MIANVTVAFPFWTWLAAIRRVSWEDVPRLWGGAGYTWILQWVSMLGANPSSATPSCGF